MPAAVAAVTSEAAVVMELLLFISWNSRDWHFDRLQADDALRNDGNGMSRLMPLSTDVRLTRRCDRSAVMVGALAEDADSGELCVDMASGRRKTPSWLRQLVCDSTDFGESADDSRYSLDWNSDWVGVSRLPFSNLGTIAPTNCSSSSYFSALNRPSADKWPAVENRRAFVLDSKRSSCSLKLK